MADRLHAPGCTVAPLACRVGLGIEAFVDHDPLRLRADRAEDIWVETRCPMRGTPNSRCRVVELDADLQVLLDDVLDRDGRFIPTPRAWAYSRKQRLRIPFDRIVGDIGN